MPAYTPDVPQPQQAISFTQPLIRQNFLQIQDWTNVDHVVISGAGGEEGMHARVSLINRGATIPTFTPSVNPSGLGTLGLFAKQYTVDTITTTQIFSHIVRKTTATPGVYTSLDVPFTASILTLNNSPTKDILSWTYLPSGILMKWGEADLNNIAAGDNFLNINANASGQAFQRILNVQITTTTTNSATTLTTPLQASAVSNTAFAIVRAQGSGPLAGIRAFWLCIGF
jgi:hypothetical protein